jgi:hypothetical protein
MLRSRLWASLQQKEQQQQPPQQHATNALLSLVGEPAAAGPAAAQQQQHATNALLTLVGDLHRCAQLYMHVSTYCQTQTWTGIPVDHLAAMHSNRSDNGTRVSINCALTGDSRELQLALRIAAQPSQVWNTQKRGRHMVDCPAAGCGMELGLVRGV